MIRWILTVMVAAATGLGAPPPEDLARARDEGRRCAAALADGSPEDAFLDCLSRYVRLPTINPPGHEELGVEFLEAIFQSAGIPTKRLRAPGRNPGEPARTSLVATLSPEPGPYAWSEAEGHPRGKAPLPSILLLNHIDVVDVFPEQWVRPELTFGGQIASYPGRDPRELHLWGRGALDMKGIALLQLLSMVRLKREGTPLKREIHFLAVADEEQSAIGATHAVGQIRVGGELEALRGAETLLGEGGFGVKDVVGAGTVIHAIGSEEKGGAWLKLSHPGFEGLMTALAKYDLVPARSGARVSRREARDWGCSVATVTTPKMKVNVVPSRVELTLKCVSPPPAERLASLFRGDPVTATAAVEGRLARVVVETPSSSHGSLGLNRSALEALGEGLQRMRILELRDYGTPEFFRYYQTEATKNLIDAIGRSHKMSYVPHFNRLTRWISWWNFLEQKALGYLGAQLSTERLFRTSCTWTGLSVDHAGASALMDCRLMHPAAMGLKPGQREGTQFAALLGRHAADPLLRIAVQEQWDFSASPSDHPTMTVIRRELGKLDPTAVTPYLFPGGTDNHLFRNASRYTPDLKGVPSYGFFPLEASVELVGTQHGSNERYPLAQVTPSIKTYFAVVRSLSAE